ncbi:MAG: glycosyltransferase family 39 protein, partial [Longimicrobiales bacterium]
MRDLSGETSDGAMKVAGTSESDPVAPNGRGRSEHTWIALAIALGLIVRVGVALNSQVWLDEANSVLIALSPLSDFGAVFAPDSSPPLYYIVLKLWAFVAPIDPFWLRVPSILFGVATIPVLWMVGRAMDRPETGVVAAWLVALHPLHVYYSEEIRMYSMLVLLGLLFYYGLFHRLKEDGNSVPAILASIALSYTHYYGLVLVGVGFTIALLAYPTRRRAVAVAGAVVGIAFLPWVPVFIAQMNNPHHVAWIGSFWESYPKGWGVLRTAMAFVPGGMQYDYVPLSGSAPQHVLPVLVLGPFALLVLRKEGRDFLARRWLPLGVAGAVLVVLAGWSYVS